MRISWGDWKCPGDFMYVYGAHWITKKRVIDEWRNAGKSATPLVLSVGKNGLAMKGLNYWYDFVNIYIHIFVLL